MDTTSPAAGHQHIAVEGQPEGAGPCRTCGQGPASPLHPQPATFTPYLAIASIPDEPRDMSVVIGKSGLAYQRSDDPPHSDAAAVGMARGRWASLLRGAAPFVGGETLRWAGLLATDGPVLVVHHGEPTRQVEPSIEPIRGLR